MSQLSVVDTDKRLLVEVTEGERGTLSTSVACPTSETLVASEKLVELLAVSQISSKSNLRPGSVTLERARLKEVNSGRVGEGRLTVNVELLVVQLSKTGCCEEEGLPSTPATVIVLLVGPTCFKGGGDDTVSCFTTVTDFFDFARDFWGRFREV